MGEISVHEKNVFIAATGYYKSSNYTHFLIMSYDQCYINCFNYIFLDMHNMLYIVIRHIL